MSDLEAVHVPDIGDYKDVRISEVLVKAGDRIEPDDPLIAIETDKATMEVPSPVAGIVRELRVDVGQKVSQGSLILSVEPSGLSRPVSAPSFRGEAGQGPRPAERVGVASGGGEAEPGIGALQPSPERPDSGSSPSAVRNEGGEGDAKPPIAPAPPESATRTSSAHATPSVRKQARELGVDLTRVLPTGPKNRITHEDLLAFVKAAVAAPAASSPGPASNLPPWPTVDFAKYGPVERQPLSRIRSISGQNLARNWAAIPHVTNFDEADVTDLERFRSALNAEHAKAGRKVTMLAFLIKAVAAALKRFPTFNASLDGGDLVLKRYIHIGFAADTPRGLLVPVIRDADRKGVLDLADEAAALARSARDGTLKPEAMQGGCFSISSLGGIGGTGFTPIINAPEVAILGVAKAAMKPVWDGAAFQPRLMLPLSLSWDHRVVDGAEAGRFLAHLAQTLGDLRRLVL